MNQVSVCVCVCVCEGEMERQTMREGVKRNEMKSGGLERRRDICLASTGIRRHIHHHRLHWHFPFSTRTTTPYTDTCYFSLLCRFVPFPPSSHRHKGDNHHHNQWLTENHPHMCSSGVHDSPETAQHINVSSVMATGALSTAHLEIFWLRREFGRRRHS